MLNYILKLYPSQPIRIGNVTQTTFATEPTNISCDNADEFFRYDHTPIKFSNGQRHGNNFEFATAIVFDIDNSNSDDPNDWKTVESVSTTLKEMGFNHWIVTSRNHLKVKNEKEPRPKFHVYLPLSTPIFDKEKYTSFCKWCIRTFNSDPQVKSHAQLIFGYGDNPEPFITEWEEGCSIDEVLTADNLATVKKPLPLPIPPQEEDAPIEQSPQTNNVFDWFAESGEWRKHLSNLEAQGWMFFEKGDKTFFQTPEGDHLPDKHDGNIDGGVAYFFSKAPPPFEDNKGYSLCQFFAGALFNSIDKKGLAKLANQYFPDTYPKVDVPLTKPILRNPLLKSLLKQVKNVDFHGIASAKNCNRVTKKEYQVITVSEIIRIAKENGGGLALNNGFVYLYNGNYWNLLDMDEFKAFLAAVAIRCGCPELDARHHLFRDELFRQFVSDGNLPVPQESKTTLINLMNGTFEISESSQILRTPKTADFLKHQLPFNFDATATAPIFQTFLDRVLPEIELQAILAEFIGYIFVFGLKLEKVLILYGTGANGKSVFFEVILALLGRENVSSYSLSSLTASNNYQRAELQNKLLNYASEINGKLGTEVFKQLASGEPVESRRIYGHPFMMYRYAKLMFNANELPHEVENTNAFFRRFIIVPFRVTIPEDEQDPELARKIIANELPGVFNWVLGGLRRLLKNRKFTESDIAREQAETYKRESDSVEMFLNDMKYHPSTVEFKAVSEFYNEYKTFCHDDGYRAVSKKKLTKRCRDKGYVIDKNRGYVIYAEKRY